MTDKDRIVEIIRAHIAEANKERLAHIARSGITGNIEASFAAHKAGWLKTILREFLP